MTISKSDHSEIVNDDSNDEIIRQKFKALFAQETVPDQLTQNILKMAADELAKNSSNPINSVDHTAQQNIISFPKTTTEKNSLSDTTSIPSPTATKTHSSRKWLSLAAAITALGLISLMLYQQKQGTHEVTEIAQQHNNPVTQPSVVIPEQEHNTVQPLNTTPDSKDSGLIAQQQPSSQQAPENVVPESAVQKKSPSITPPVIAQNKPAPGAEQFPPAKVQMEDSFPDMMQANEHIDEGLSHQEFSDMYPASEPVQDEMENSSTP